VSVLGVRAAAVRVRGLVVAAGGRTLLGPVDLDVDEGEHVLLVGRSGSGKTTLLRAVAGLVAPTRGSIELFGTRASEAGALLVPPERRGVGMLFQGGALWPHMDVARTLTFVLARAHKDRERVGSLLEEVRLSGFERRFPSTLSGGERQRLALARAIAAEPRLLLLDEPLGPLDRALRSEMLALLAGLQAKHGWTILHVTHDPAEASALSSRVLRLAEGRVIDTLEQESGR
jgi:iron(III) transport system ATP-binding protein